MARPNPEPRTIPQSADPARSAYAMRLHFDEARAGASVSIGPESGGSVRKVSVQVVDRLRTPWKRRWLLRVWTSTTQFGPVSGGTMTVTTGRLVQSRSIDQDIDVVTDDGGLVEIDLAAVGATTRFVHVVVVDEVIATDAIAFA